MVGLFAFLYVLRLLVQSIAYFCRHGLNELRGTLNPYHPFNMNRLTGHSCNSWRSLKRMMYDGMTTVRCLLSSISGHGAPRWLAGRHCRNITATEWPNILLSHRTLATGHHWTSSESVGRRVYVDWCRVGARPLCHGPSHNIRRFVLRSVVPEIETIRSTTSAISADHKLWTYSVPSCSAVGLQ